ILGDLAVGDDVRVYVLNPEDSKGHILLSLRRALEEQDWQVAEEHLESKQSYESKVQSYNKGG
ncbi:MAG: 30S ribosomal protein S1, partial [Desulfuromonadales bacterium]|nr:30S ribosomal protein S1 [Desulfuromonadales bacterium]NIS41179.1 30S ribosomal protein S1 [Desulfuromonadales bacterium]